MTIAELRDAVRAGAVYVTAFAIHFGICGGMTLWGGHMLAVHFGMPWIWTAAVFLSGGLAVSSASWVLFGQAPLDPVRRDALTTVLPGQEPTST